MASSSPAIEDPASNSSRWFYSSNTGSNRPYVDINLHHRVLLHDASHLER